LLLEAAVVVDLDVVVFEDGEELEDWAGTCRYKNRLTRATSRQTQVNAGRISLFSSESPYTNSNF